MSFIKKNLDAPVELFSPISKAEWALRRACWQRGYRGIEVALDTLAKNLDAIAERHVSKSLSGSDRAEAVAIAKSRLRAKWSPTALDIAKSIRALMRQAMPDIVIAEDHPQDEERRRKLDDEIAVMEADVMQTHLNSGNAPSGGLDDASVNVTGQPLTSRGKVRERIARAQKNVRFYS
jgi:hypothetical protein